MLAVGRDLMTRSKIILLDEPSMGLAPLIVEEVFRIIQKVNKDRKRSDEDVRYQV
jgi:branched-chain amino acid transport system ATP-binding protein